MIRKKNTASVGISIYMYLAMSFLILINCSKDETEPSISIEPISVSFTEINTCDINSCCLATRFAFNVGYRSTGGVKVSKVLADLTWSDGEESSNETKSFKDTGSGINYKWCFKFGNADWVQVTNRLVSEDGVTSAPSMVKVNKPEGAN